MCSAQVLSSRVSPEMDEPFPVPVIIGSFRRGCISEDEKPSDPPPRMSSCIVTEVHFAEHAARYSWSESLCGQLTVRIATRLGILNN